MMWDDHVEKETIGDEVALGTSKEIFENVNVLREEMEGYARWKEN